MLIILTLIFYTAVRFEALYQKRDTIRSAIAVEDWIDETHVFNFERNNFQLAFAIEDYVTREGKDDPSYVEWIVQLRRSMNGTVTEFPLKYHKCNETNYGYFHPSSKKAER